MEGGLRGRWGAVGSTVEFLALFIIVGHVTYPYQGDHLRPRLKVRRGGLRQARPLFRQSFAGMAQPLFRGWHGRGWDGCDFVKRRWKLRLQSRY